MQINITIVLFGGESRSGCPAAIPVKESRVQTGVYMKEISINTNSVSFKFGSERKESLRRHICIISGCHNPVYVIRRSAMYNGNFFACKEHRELIEELFRTGKAQTRLPSSQRAERVPDTFNESRS